VKGKGGGIGRERPTGEESVGRGGGIPNFSTGGKLGKSVVKKKGVVGGGMIKTDL